MYLKAQFSLTINGLVVRLWVYTPNVGSSNLHTVASYNFIHKKFCRPKFCKGLFLVYALNFIMLKEFYEISTHSCFLVYSSNSIKLS